MGIVRQRHAGPGPGRRLPVRLPARLPILLPVLLLAAQAAADGVTLRERIDEALLQVGPNALAAVRVVSLARGEVLYERNADLSMNPASNMKLFTSAAALAKLGPGYRFTTSVLTTARPDRSGLLKGDLVLKGGGDPVLETSGLEELADGVRAAGVRRVSGSLLVDDSRYDAARLGNGWNWDDEPFYYSAQISALSVDRNVMKVEVRPGDGAGRPARVRLLPLPDYGRIVAVPTTGSAGSETDLDHTRERGRNAVRVTGTIAAGSGPEELSVTMEDPALFAGKLFRKLLEARGIRIGGTVQRGPAPASPLVTVSRQSPPLSRITALLNKPSDNLVAEMLLKELGFVGKKAGTSVAGSEVVEGWLKEIGIDTQGVKVNDGSGLSRMDLVNARAVSDLLLFADRASWREPFLQSLPVGGVDGTLRSRLKGTAAERNVRAKTGTLSHVTALGGYVTTAAGERLAFSILINNYPGPTGGPRGAKRFEDMIAVALAEEGREKPTR